MTNIIQEQHDLNEIQFDGTSAEPRSLPKLLESPEAFESYWDAYELGTSFEAARAAWQEANGPEARQRVLDDLRDRAIKRADLTVVGGKVGVIVAGEAAHHGLGYRVDAAMSTDDLFSICKPLNREYYTVPLSYSVNGTQMALKGRKGIAFTDWDGTTGLLEDTAVSDGFRIMQIRQSAAFLDGVIGGSGAQWDTAGLIRNGREVFLSALLPDTLEVVPGDELRCYMLISDAFDSGRYWSFKNTSTRSVCANTHNLALSTGVGGVSVRHTKSLHQRIDMALQAVNKSRAAFKTFGELSQVLVRSQVKASEYFDTIAEAMARDSMFSGQLLTDEQILDGPKTLMRGELNTEAAERDFDRRLSNRMQLKSRWEAIAETATNTVPGSIWGYYNAVTQYANHELRYQGSDVKRRESRYSSIMEGRAAKIDSLAIDAAKALVA